MIDKILILPTTSSFVVLGVNSSEFIKKRDSDSFNDNESTIHWKIWFFGESEWANLTLKKLGAF